MCYLDRTEMLIGEVAIAKVAGGKFDALLVKLGIEPCVEMDAMEWDA